MIPIPTLSLLSLVLSFLDLDNHFCFALVAISYGQVLRSSSDITHPSCSTAASQVAFRLQCPNRLCALLLFTLITAKLVSNEL